MFILRKHLFNIFLASFYNSSTVLDLFIIYSMILKILARRRRNYKAIHLEPLNF